jgi:hypothetical protein
MGLVMGCTRRASEDPTPASSIPVAGDDQEEYGDDEDNWTYLEQPGINKYVDVGSKAAEVVQDGANKRGGGLAGHSIAQRSYSVQRSAEDCARGPSIAHGPAFLQGPAFIRRLCQRKGFIVPFATKCWEAQHNGKATGSARSTPKTYWQLYRRIRRTQSQGGRLFVH